MANPEHVEILIRGVDIWNAWRKEYPSLKPDLSGVKLSPQLVGADLSGVNLTGADFGKGSFHAYLAEGWPCRLELSRTDLTRANLSDADLSGADLSNANLTGTNLARADLSEVIAEMDLYGYWGNTIEADLSNANIRNADMSDTNLGGANLSGALLYHINFIGADFRGESDPKGNRGTILEETIFADVNLKDARGLEKCRHWGPSIIDHRTLQHSGSLPLAFLRGCGLSDVEIKMVRLYDPNLTASKSDELVSQILSVFGNPPAQQYYSCFISYNYKDDDFAKRIYDDLQNIGVRCWFAPEDMKIGDRIRPRIDQEIRLRDKLMVIISENSIVSEWIGDEVEAALEEEKASDRTILFPIRLDDAVMESRSDWAAKIKRRRHIGDFSQWQDEAKYQKAFERLLRDLKATSGE
jgi:uncharacterized protein YjbI with pentapeptide repeats